MALSMASPQKHPKTGVYWFRKRVPDRLRPLVGKTEIVQSLRTKDVREAKARHASVAARLAREWQLLELRAAEPERIVTLSTKQAHALAGEVYREMVARREDEPGSVAIRRLDAGKVRTALGNARSGFSDPDGMDRDLVDEVAGGHVDYQLAARGLIVDETSRRKLIIAVLQALVQASDQVVRLAEGDYRPDQMANRFPPIESLQIPSADILDWRDEFEKFSAERDHAPTTRRDWHNRVAELMGRVGTDDLRQLKPEHVVSWKDDLVSRGLSAGTINNRHLAAIKSFCSWVVEQHRLGSNPAEGIRISSKKGRKIESNEENRGLRHEHALKILKATLEPQRSRLNEVTRAARRWIPWLCAYTGARVNELTQLRRQDISRHSVDGALSVWMIRITPDAGRTKDNRARTVPIHPHLIEQGFLDFVRHCGRDRLFVDENLKRGSSDPKSQARKRGEDLASWVTSILGAERLTQVAPNHGWRHRFRSKCLAVGIPERVTDHIVGHAPTTVGRKYGVVWPAVALHAIGRLPSYPIEAPTTEAGRQEAADVREMIERAKEIVERLEGV